MRDLHRRVGRLVFLVVSLAAVGLAVTLFFMKSDAAVRVTAAATFLLAAATAWMASETRGLSKHAEEEAKAVRDQAVATQAQADSVSRQAESAARQVEVTAGALEATIRPWLTASPEREPFPSMHNLGEGTDHPGETVIEVYVDFINVGPGLAVIPPGGTLLMGSRSTRFGTVPFTGIPSRGVIPPGGSTTIRFQVPINARDGKGLTIQEFVGQPNVSGEFFVWVKYTDANGHQPTAVHASVAFDQVDGVWIVARMEFRGAGGTDPWGRDQDPFASIESF